MSNKAFVANQSAARIYQENRYERVCVGIKGPASCAEMKQILDLLEIHDKTGKPVGLIPLANQVQAVGEIPSQERSELKKLMDRLEDLP